MTQTASRWTVCWRGCEAQCCLLVRRHWTNATQHCHLARCREIKTIQCCHQVSQHWTNTTKCCHLPRRRCYSPITQNSLLHMKTATMSTIFKTQRKQGQRVNDVTFSVPTRVSATLWGDLYYVPHCILLLFSSFEAMGRTQTKMKRREQRRKTHKHTQVSF